LSGPPAKTCHPNLSIKASFAVTSCTSVGPGDDRGFTLIEVLVALVITLIALDVLSGGIVSSLRTAHDTAVWDQAVSRAESHLAAITDPGRVLGERRGDDGGGYRWRTQVAFLGSAPAPNVSRGGLWARGTGLYAVSVTEFWQAGHTEQSFVLNSARLGPVPGAEP
jgi:general secretion pathway protein I